MSASTASPRAHRRERRRPQIRVVPFGRRRYLKRRSKLPRRGVPASVLEDARRWLLSEVFFHGLAEARAVLAALGGGCELTPPVRRWLERHSTSRTLNSSRAAVLLRHFEARESEAAE